MSVHCGGGRDGGGRWGEASHSIPESYSPVYLLYCFVTGNKSHPKVQPPHSPQRPSPYPLYHRGHIQTHEPPKTWSQR